MKDYAKGIEMLMSFQSPINYREDYVMVILKFFLTRPLKNGIFKFAMH